MGGQMTIAQAWATVVILAASFVYLGITVTTRDEALTELRIVRDSVTILRDSLNATRAEPIYFNELKLIGFDCRLLVDK